MNNKSFGLDLDLKRRWVLLVETQMCIWESVNSMPEVDISQAHVIEYYQSRQDALQGIQTYLTMATATAQWSDVRPTETCACCGSDIDTSKWHEVLALTVEEGPIDNPVLLDAQYPARFCTGCVPSNLKGVRNEN